MRGVKVALSMGANGITATAMLSAVAHPTHLCGDGAILDVGGGYMTSLIL